ncbi:nucleotidyltransferase family protein [Chloroflexus sp.]|uniref:nucleotidyltransferase family protein n=1 Tax=Chloroflexus sp. TaxID=1904827 RepID=UPI002ACE646C|nr:nucleotidyltransferase family protein [Chloroflexus sp.]
MTGSQLLKEQRAEMLAIYARYGTRNVRIFGSVARGDADEQSDIDFIVDREEERTPFDLGGLQYDLELLLKLPVDIVTESGLKLRMRDRVLHEARAL